MKTNFRYVTGFSIAVFSAALLLAVPAYALEGSNDTEPDDRNKISETNSKSSVFCKSFDTLNSKTVGELTKKNNSSKSKWQSSLTDVQTKKSEWAAKVAAARAEAAKKRDANFATLEEAATTPEQDTAVGTYKETVLAAVAKRQAAYDAAFIAYFSGVAALITSQTTNTGGDTAAFKAAVTAAVDKAKAACATGQSSEQVKKQLKVDLKAARDSYKGERTTDKSVFKAKIADLKKVRKAATDTAREEFKQTLETARTELKAAFPSTDDSEV